MGPFKCPECGVWWAGEEHRCKLGDLVDANGSLSPSDRFLIREVRMSGTATVPWCGICQAGHIPGAGPCTGTWT
jgi:hypothetical protein